MKVLIDCLEISLKSTVELLKTVNTIRVPKNGEDDGEEQKCSYDHVLIFSKLGVFGLRHFIIRECGCVLFGLGVDKGNRKWPSHKCLLVFRRKMYALKIRFKVDVLHCEIFACSFILGFSLFCYMNWNVVCMIFGRWWLLASSLGRYHGNVLFPSRSKCYALTPVTWDVKLPMFLACYSCKWQ